MDVGDHSQGGVLGYITDGVAVIEIMNKIRFDVITIGNHEFDYGIEQLHKLNSSISKIYISLNAYYRKNKTRLFEPSTIIEAGNKKNWLYWNRNTFDLFKDIFIKSYRR